MSRDLRDYRNSIRCTVPFVPKKTKPVSAPIPSNHLPGNHRLGEALKESGRIITLDAKERKAHTHIMGGSGRGKSYLMQLLIRQDLDDPDCGLCLLDPHGNLYAPLVWYLAESRPDLAERVILFDPSGRSGYVPGFNPIGVHTYEHPEYTLNMLVEACLRAWGQDRTNLTPRITRQLENIFALIIVNGLTILETIPLISSQRSSEKRRQLLAALNHDLIRAEWEEFEMASSTVRQQLLEGAGNRLRRFLGSAVIRQVLGQQEHVLDIDRIIAEKKILLVNLQTGMGLSRENSNLLGILMINELFRVAMLRDPNKDPHPFYLYIDEFAQLITPAIANILDECRKYGLFLTLAHQHLKQLKTDDDWLLGSILANCHNRVMFGGLDVNDAELLARQLYVGFEDLKQVKHTEYQTKFRPVEETRTVISESRGVHKSRSEQFSESYGHSTSLSHSIAEAIARGSSWATARSENRGKQFTRGATRTNSVQQGGQRSDGVSEEQGMSMTKNWSDAESKQHQEGESTGEQQQKGTQLSRQNTENAGKSIDGEGNLVQRQTGGSAATATADSESASTSRQRQFSTTEGKSHTEGGGMTVTGSKGTSHSEGTSWGRGEAAAVSEQLGISVGSGLTETNGGSRTETHTETAGETETTSTQRGRATGLSEGESESKSVSIVPFHRMEEYQEAHETFWTPAEIELMRTGEMKEQPMGIATLKVGPNAPLQVKVDALPPFALGEDAADAAVEKFVSRVTDAFPEFYATPEEIRREIEARQMETFGEVMRLELRPAKLGIGNGGTAAGEEGGNIIEGELEGGEEEQGTGGKQNRKGQKGTGRQQGGGGPGSGGRFADDDD